MKEREHKSQIFGDLHLAENNEKTQDLKIWMFETQSKQSDGNNSPKQIANRKYCSSAAICKSKLSGQNYILQTYILCI